MNTHTIKLMILLPLCFLTAEIKALDVIIIPTYSCLNKTNDLIWYNSNNDSEARYFAMSGQTFTIQTKDASLRLLSNKRNSLFYGLFESMRFENVRIPSHESLNQNIAFNHAYLIITENNGKLEATLDKSKK